MSKEEYPTAATGMNVVKAQSRQLAMPIQGLSDIERVGQMFASSGMFGCKNAEQGNILALTCYTEGMTPVQFKRRYHMIDGDISMRADAMLAEFRMDHGGNHEWITRGPDGCAIKLIRADGYEAVFSLSWEDAQKEPFVWSSNKDKQGNPIPKKNYATPRARMQTMAARVASEGVRAVCPEVNAGCYAPEELQDLAKEVFADPELREANAPTTLGGDKTTAAAPAAAPAPAKCRRKAKEEPKAAEKPPIEAEVKEDTPLDIDPKVMPIGPRKGMPWTKFATVELETVQARGGDHGVTSACIEEIAKEIESRKGQE